jgi:sugar (pentulose or hexulose) kinase
VLRRHGIEPTLVRATGEVRVRPGGCSQADLTGVPVEVVAQEEPGAFGAAILAGVGAGAFPSVSTAVERLVGVGRRFEPDAERGARYAGVRERLAGR